MYASRLFFAMLLVCSCGAAGDSSRVVVGSLHPSTPADELVTAGATVEFDLSMSSGWKGSRGETFLLAREGARWSWVLWEGPPPGFEPYGNGVDSSAVALSTPVTTLRLPDALGSGRYLLCDALDTKVCLTLDVLAD